MKFTAMLLAAAALATTAGVTTAADAATLASTLTAINGSWSYGNTQWNGLDTLGYVDNANAVSAVGTLFSGPYTYSAPESLVANGIYSWGGSPYGTGNASLVFSANGGIATVLDSVSILSSRSYSSGTQITLDYSNDHGLTWVNALSTTTGAAGWVDLGTGGTGTETITLTFGGVVGNAFRFGTMGDQVSLHSVTLDGVAAAVPEPATWAMMLAGFGMIGFAARRRASVKTTVAYA